MVKRIVLFIFILLSHSVFGQSKEPFTVFINRPHPWVDSVFKTLTPAEKVGQLFLVRVHTNLGQRHIDSVAKVISTEKLGGVVFFQGGPVRHAIVINRYQALSKVPLLMAMDGEWGLGMRLADSTISYPYQMALGAIQQESLIYQMGQMIGRDFKRLGLNLNFAPVVDINNNARNPVINFRSFGENRENVTRKGAAYMKGLMDKGVLTTLKHFPGHGDTDVDSHKDLPQLDFTEARLDSMELYPFKSLIKQDAPGVMVAHMNIPALDKTPHLPSSLSPNVVNDLLKERLGFKGLAITDAMDMNGVVKYFKNGEADILAVLAGNDLLELSQNTKRAINGIQQAIQSRRISQEVIDARVKKILAAKLWLGLDHWEKVELNHLYADLNKRDALELNQQLADASLTLLKGDSLIKALNYTQKTAIISIGSAVITPFQSNLVERFDNVLNFVLSADAKPNDVAKVWVELLKYKQLIVALHDERKSPQSNIQYSNTVRFFINELVNMNSILVLFANPYTLAGMPGIEQAKSILIAYQNTNEMQMAAAKALLQQLKPSGKLPVTVNAFFKYGDGVRIK